MKLNLAVWLNIYKLKIQFQLRKKSYIKRYVRIVNQEDRRATLADEENYRLRREETGDVFSSHPLMIADASSGYLFTINNNHSIMTRDVDVASRGSLGSGLILLFLRSDLRQTVPKGAACWLRQLVACHEIPSGFGW